MSALPLPPLHDLPEEPPRRPNRWRRVAAWILGAITAVIVVVVIAVVVLLHSSRFHRYVIRTAEQKAAAALGTQVTVENYVLNLHNLSLDVYGVVVNGAEPYPTPPLLQVDHAHLQIGILSLFKREWFVKDAQLDHPVVRAFFDKAGKNNLPTPQKSNGQSHTSILDLGVRHALLNRGEIYYNNRKSLLDADILDLAFRASFDPSARRYSGTLAYNNGHIQYGAYRPIPHSLNASFTATPDTFNLDPAMLASGHSQFVLSATVHDYSNPNLNARYSATLDSSELRREFRNASLPLGEIQLRGSLSYQAEPNRPLLEGVRLNGELSSNRLTLETPKLRTSIQNLSARYSVANGNAELNNLRAGILGGELTGNALIRDLGGASRSTLHASLREVALSDVLALAASTTPKNLALRGAADGALDAQWGKTMSDLTAHVDATAQGSAAEQGTSYQLPIRAGVHANYSAPTRTVALVNSYFRLPHTSLELNGAVSQRSALQVALRSSDLHELETIADRFRSAKNGSVPQPLGVYGTASFNGTVRGSTSAPHLAGRLNAENLRLKGSAWRALRTDVALDPNSISLQNGQLKPQQKGNIQFDLQAALRHWEFGATNPIQLQLAASDLNVADLLRAAGSQIPVAGTLTVKLSVRGSQAQPIGKGELSLTNAKVEGEPIQSVNANFNGTASEARADLNVRAAAGSLRALLTYFPQNRGYDFNLQAPGLRLDRLQTLKARNLNVSGALNISANGQGTISNPQLTADINSPNLQVQGQKINNLNLQANVANHVANLTLGANAVNTSLAGKATVRLEGDYFTVASIDTQPIPLQPLVAAYAPSQSGNINGETELHATLRGPLNNKTQMEAHAVIPVLRMAYKNTFQMAAAQPVHLDYTNGVLKLQRTAIRGTDTDLQLQGSVPVSSNAQLSLLMLGTVDLKVLQVFSPDVSSSGQLRFNINSFGQRSNPDVQGNVELVNANFATGSMPLGMQNGNGVLTLTKDRLQISRFKATVGGGDVTASGGVIYKPNLRFDLALAGNDIRLLYPDTVRETLFTNLALTGSMQSARLSGDVRVTQLSFTPDFDLADFMGQFSSSTTTAPPQGFMQNLQLDLAVQSSNNINLVSKQLSVQGAANLQVRGTAAQPVVLGRINLTGGDLIYNKDRFVLQGGTIDFVNPSQTQPTLNVGVNTTIQQYNIHMMFRGPIDHLQTSYTSDPALPPSDIISLLISGQTSESAAANPTPGNLQAESMVASGVTGQLTNRIQKIAGISQLSVDPVLGGTTQENPGARVTIQQRVTSKLFVTFSSDVTSTQRQTIEVEYQYTPRVSFSGTRDQNGGFGFDMRIHKSW